MHINKNHFADLCIYASAIASVISVMHVTTNMYYVCNNTDSMVTVSKFIDGGRAVVIIFSVLARFVYHKYYHYEPTTAQTSGDTPKGALTRFKGLILILGGLGFLTFILTLVFSHKVCQSGNCLTAAAADRCNENPLDQHACQDAKIQGENMAGGTTNLPGPSIMSHFRTAENYCKEAQESMFRLNAEKTFYGEQCLAFACNNLVNGKVARSQWLLACVILVTIGNVCAVIQMNEDENKIAPRRQAALALNGSDGGIGEGSGGGSGNDLPAAVKELFPKNTARNFISNSTANIRRRNIAYSAVNQDIDF